MEQWNFLSSGWSSRFSADCSHVVSPGCSLDRASDVPCLGVGGCGPVRFAIVLTMTLLLYSLIFQTVDLNFLLEQIQFYVR